jgi:hypothetical protein
LIEAHCRFAPHCPGECLDRCHELASVDVNVKGVGDLQEFRQTGAPVD